MEALEQLKSVLCDPEGSVCISGSDGDRKVIADALEALEQQVAALTEYNKTRTDELIAAGKQVAALTNERDALQNKLNAVVTVGIREREQLAAAQAREAMLRTYIAQGLGNYSLRVAAADLLVEAIALPTDDSALMERLKQERERCAVECDNMRYASNQHCAEAIRSLK